MHSTVKVFVRATVLAPDLSEHGPATIRPEILGRFFQGEIEEQAFRPLMERFGATENGLRIANQLKEMVGTTGLEPATSTVSSRGAAAGNRL